MTRKFGKLLENFKGVQFVGDSLTCINFTYFFTIAFLGTRMVKIENRPLLHSINFPSYFFFSRNTLA